MKTTFTLLCFSCLFAASAQEFPYTFTYFQEPYADLTESTSISGEEVWDDPQWLVPIGFPFSYMGEVMENLVVIYPGSQLVPVSMENEVALLFPYASDIMNASWDEPVSPVSYVLEGEPGSRIFKLEWKNVGFYNEGEMTNNFANTTNFQVWLYETTNVVEIRFGPNTIKSGDIIHFYGAPAIMLGMDVALDGSSWAGLWTVAGDPAAPTIAVVTSVDKGGLSAEQVLAGEPANGQVYRFSNGPVSVGEVVAAEPFSLWPSPCDEQLNIRWNGQETTQYTITDLSGRILRSGMLVPGVQSIETSALATGVYFLRTEVDGRMRTQRFVKR